MGGCGWEGGGGGGGGGKRELKAKQMGATWRAIVLRCALLILLVGAVVFESPREGP